MRCRTCHRLLEAPDLQRGLTLCRRAACQGGNEARRIEARRDELTRTAMAAVQALQPPRAVREPVWLLPFPAQPVATTDDQRALLAQALQPLAAEAAEAASAASAAPAASAPTAIDEAGAPDPMDGLGAALCGHCGGRCCTAGRDDHAFLHDGALQRWFAQHPGALPEAAVADYLAALPPAHVEGSCLFHTPQGCALPRERRSDTCNNFKCVPYKTLQAAAGARPPQGVAVLRARGGQMESLALITPQGGFEPLPLPDPAAG